MDYKVTPYTNKIFASDILSYLNVDSTGDVVSVEVWNTLWNSVFDFASNVNEHMQELLAEDTGLIPRLIAEHTIMLSEHAQILQEHEVLKKQFAAITEAINHIDQQAADINVKHKEVLDTAAALTEGFVHCGPDAPQNPNTVLWIRPTDNAPSVVGVGEPTPEGGEIFNDYNNNIATAENSHTEGNKNRSGSKAFKILGWTITSQDNYEDCRIELDNNAGIEQGDIVSLFLYNQYDDFAEIQGTEGFRVNGKMCYWVHIYLEKNGTMPETYSAAATNQLRIAAKPDIGTIFIGFGAHSEGVETQALNKGSHSEGYKTIASGSWSHAENRETYANYAAHAEGIQTKATGQCSHSEGNKTEAKGYGSHAEGGSTIAIGEYSHAENATTTAEGNYSHAQGNRTIAKGVYSHAGGLYSNANHNASFVHGRYLSTGADSQAVFGKYNNGLTNAVFIIGNGTAGSARSNAFVAFQDGHAEVQTMGGTDNSVATKKYVDQELASFDFIKVVDELPVEGLSNKIYLVPSKTTTKQDLFDEYIWINKGAEDAPEFGWEFIAAKVVEVDLTNYVTQPTLATALDNVNTELDAMRNTLEALGVDYIVEHGASGVWTWEKWNSGTIKMWCKAITSNVNEYIARATISYPTSITLIEEGCAFATINSGFQNLGFGLDINAKAIAGGTMATIYAHKLSGSLTEDNSNIPVSLFIIGKWK